MYASSWFLTVFSSFSALDLPTTLRVWDRFLTAGWKEVFRFALAIMQCLEVDWCCELIPIPGRALMKSCVFCSLT
jgi:Rab-GTPase-TBC domain